MHVTKCDICKKQIKDYNKEVNVAPPGKLSSLTFCLNCGKPVIRFLNSHHLIEKPKNK